MKIKQTLEMQTFKDGIIRIYALNDNDNPTIIKYSNLRFDKRVVGIKRYYAAAQTESEIIELVRISYVPNITTYDIAVIGDKQYEIKQVQDIIDALPHSIDLTLRERGKFNNA